MAGHIIKVLPLITLLLCVTNVIPRERVNNFDERNRVLGSLPASTLRPAAPLTGDGLIAFAADRQIYIMNADGSDVRLLTDGNPHAIYRYPAISPDGSRVAFTRDEDSDHALYVMGIDGSNLRRLSSSFVGVSEPAWSPDGSKIAYVRGYDTTYGGHANITTCGSEIYVIDVFSHKQTNMTQGAGGTDPAWSPDGTRIAFSSFRGGNHEIYTMTSSGNEVKRLTDTGGAEADPAWSPDGTRIAYTAHLTEGMFYCGFMSTGRPGGSQFDERPSVYVMLADGSNQTQLEAASGGREPTWSPDGAWLALVVSVRGDLQIYVTDAGGTSLTPLTSDWTKKSSPSWASALKIR